MSIYACVRQARSLRAIGIFKRGFADETVARGINIKKGGTDPLLKPADEYPEWLPGVTDREKALYDFRRKIEAEGEQSLEFEELVRYIKLNNRATIKQRNNAKAKR